jgi:hypothetical protein
MACVMNGRDRKEEQKGTGKKRAVGTGRKSKSGQEGRAEGDKGTGRKSRRGQE